MFRLTMQQLLNINKNFIKNFNKIKTKISRKFECTFGIFGKSSMNRIL